MIEVTNIQEQKLNKYDLKRFYSKKDIIAVIVTYNPDETLKDNVFQIMRQVEKVLIIDNNSFQFPDSNLYKKLDRVEFINNQNNIGLAAALNQGLEYAFSKKYFLMLSLDQDTYINDGTVETMLKVLNDNEKIVSIGPVYKEKLGFIKKNQSFKKVSYLITSGNLFRVDKAVENGGFNSSLFIDSIDFDFSLALRKSGEVLAVANYAKMNHVIGNKKEKKIFNFTFAYSEHSAIRYYYIYRNIIYIVRKYFKDFPIFCTKLIISSLFSIVKLFLLEKETKLKISYLKNGVKDGLLGRNGPYVEQSSI